MGQLTPYVSNNYGFTAIIVAFVGRLHPLGCVFGSVLLSMFLIGGELAQTMRYGENPHQSASFYRTADPRIGVATVRQLQGKELSYNNINDTDAAFELVSEFPAETPAVAIIKHANPCGVALGGNLLEAYQRALQCDPVSAFGGIVAANRTLDVAAAEKIKTSPPVAEPERVNVSALNRRSVARGWCLQALPSWSC